MSNSIAPGSSADVNVRVTALTTNPNVPAQYKTIILKKNLVNGVNTLTQEMMSATNTKYVIKYDYVLGEDITVPTNCILKFDGGSISASGSNDTITGANTDIIASLVKIFDTDVTIAGSWNVTDIYSNWFGFVEGSQNDNKKQFLNLLSVASSSVHNNIYIEDGTFYTSIVDSDFGFEIPSNTDVYNNAHICQLGTDRGKYAVFSVYDSENVTFRGGKITGDNEVHIGAITEHAHCIYLIGARNTTIENVVCEKAGGDGINIQALYSDYEHETITGHCYNITIKNVTCDYDARNGISVEGVLGCTIDTCTITNIGQGAYTPGGPWDGIDIEPWFEGQLVRDLTIKNCNIKNCKGGGIQNYIKDTLGNIVIENNDLQGISLTGSEYSNIITGNIINSLYASNAKGIIVDNNKINNYFYFEGLSENNKITNNIITVDSAYSVFAGCIIKNNIINSRIQCYANGSKFENCIINIQTEESQSMLAQGTLEFYNCTISINKAIWLSTNGGAIIKNSILDRRISDTSPLIVFTSDSYPQDPVKLIANKYINAPNSTDKVQNWGGANPNYIISDTEVEVVTQQPLKPYIGQSYFNGTKPVWYNGTAWVDATGTPV